MTKAHVIVVGAGIGGSALAALLTHAGLRVTLLEKNRYLGGSCAGYEKHGFRIDFGTHVFPRGERGPLGQVLKRVERPSAVEFRRHPDVFELRWAGPRPGYRSLTVPSSAWRLPPFALRLIRECGLSPRAVAQGMRLLARTATADDRFTDAWLYRDLEEFVSSYTDNSTIANAFYFLAGLGFVLPPRDVSAGEGLHCLRRGLLDNSLSYAKGGSKAVPTTYCRIAEELGADIRTGAGVKRILVHDGRVHGVELLDGTRLDADIVVSTSSVRTTALRLCDPATLPPDFVDNAKGITGSMIAIQAKIALNTKLVDAGCLVGAVSDSIDPLRADATMLTSMADSIAMGEIPDVIPFYCPVPTNFDASLAPPGHQLLTVCMPAPTTDIELSASPRAWDDALMNAMRRIVPGIDDHILFVDRTTTSWMEHWIGKQYGPAISTGQTPRQVGKHRPSVATPVDGLYLAGCGAGGRGVGTELAADSAMECAERILDDLGRTPPPSWIPPRDPAPTLPASIWRNLTRTAPRRIRQPECPVAHH
ncbi:phytoene desaturase family protein [Allokutzneria oryzae]|uniref:Phytoene desaturase family protein n=1 Tax=Allokutzneria oryzae TaxID=1378989 RepID=A0ABV5ZX10_9PSEU